MTTRGERTDRRGRAAPAVGSTGELAPAPGGMRRTVARRSIAVSGATSFLGRNLVGVLEEDESVRKVVVVDVARPATAGPKTRYYEVDLTHPTADSRLAEILQAEQVDVFAHLAFLSSPTQATAWAHELESVGTMHVLHACGARRIRKLVMPSTTLVYGAHPTNPNFLKEHHPTRGLRGSSFVADKLDAERQVAAFAKAHSESTVTVLRMAPVLGPTVRNYVSRWLSRRLVPTAMGFDPLVQFVHEADAVAALKRAIDHDVPGVFNVVSDGVLPISTVVKLAGRLPLPIPYGLHRRLTGLLWVAQLSEAPPAFVDGLRYLCVADGTKAREALGFRPAYTSRDAVLDFEGALRLREAKLLHEPS